MAISIPRRYGSGDDDRYTTDYGRRPKRVRRSSGESSSRTSGTLAKAPARSLRRTPVPSGPSGLDLQGQFPRAVTTLGRPRTKSVTAEEEDILPPLIPPAAFNRDLASYIAQALGMIPSAGSGGWDARREQARRQARENDARLAAIYRALAADLRTDIPALNETTSSALDDIDQRTAQDQEALQQVRDANREAEASSLARTQIGDSKLLQQSRGNADADAVFNAGQLIEGGQNQRQYTRNMADASRDLLRNNVATAGFEGAEGRAQNQMNLSAFLAALADEEQQWRNNMAQQRASQALSLANQLYNTDYGRFTDRQNYLLGLDDRAYDRAFQQDQAARDAARYQNDLQSQQFQMAMDMANANTPQSGFNTAQASILKTLIDQGMTPDQARAWLVANS